MKILGKPLDGTWLCLLSISLFFRLATASWDDPFRRFPPQYNAGFQSILRNDCRELYNEYLVNKSLIEAIPANISIFDINSLTHVVVNCVLENTPEIIKSKMASAQVVLGLAPTILATLGTGPQETGLLAVVGRRPLLALALAAGSPAVFSIRSFEYIKSIEELQEHYMHRPGFLRRLDPAMSVVELALALLSVANIGELAWQLGATVIFTALPDKEYVVLLWAFLGLTIHVLGAVAVLVRTKVKPSKRKEKKNATAAVGGGGRRGEDHAHHVSHVTEVISGQFKPLARQNTELEVKILPESTVFFVVSWVTAVYTACHIIFGTIVFSGALFISLTDSVIVIVRLMASVIVCRIILTYELSIMRSLVHVEKDQPLPQGVPNGETQRGQDGNTPHNI
ncbi:hypothetical protein BX600DRAFT_442794 [Xylariales sp. PMI_506]|nr:hypothetical protein BX600DRAFT_442794 [Xylariales sp. PMI_506]